MFYYMKDRKPVGPIPGEVLFDLCKSGVIKPWTPIRKGENGKWVTAGNNPKLAEAMEKIEIAPAKTHSHQPATVIEKTAKKWKAIQLAGYVGLLIGALICASGLSSKNEDALLGGIAVGFSGMVTASFGRWSAWWHHG